MQFIQKLLCFSVEKAFFNSLASKYPYLILYWLQIDHSRQTDGWHILAEQDLNMSQILMLKLIIEHLKGQVHDKSLAFYHLRSCFRPKQGSANWFYIITVHFFVIIRQHVKIVFWRTCPFTVSSHCRQGFIRLFVLFYPTFLSSLMRAMSWVRSLLGLSRSSCTTSSLPE